MKALAEYIICWTGLAISAMVLLLLSVWLCNMQRHFKYGRGELLPLQVHDLFLLYASYFCSVVNLLTNAVDQDVRQFEQNHIERASWWTMGAGSVRFTLDMTILLLLITILIPIVHIFRHTKGESYDST